MGFQNWRRIAWTYHILFAIAVTWPVQAVMNSPKPFILGLPGQMTWAATWVLGSLVVLWRLDAARVSESGTAARRSGPSSNGGAR